MTRNLESDALGFQLGTDAVEYSERIATQVCQFEQQRIELSNQPWCLALRAKIGVLQEQASALKERIRRAPPSGDGRARRKKARYFWAFFIFFAVSGFFFTVMAFDPYRLGWKSYLYCFGIALVAPFAVDQFLESWRYPILNKVLITLACGGAVTSLLLLATIRGDVLSQQLTALNPLILFSGEATTSVPAQASFYDDTLFRLKLLMALLALAMEISAGLALHEARRLGAESGDDPMVLGQALARIEFERESLFHELAVLQNAPGVFVATFWRDFYRAMLNGVKSSACSKFSILLLGVSLLLPYRLWAAAPNVVVAVDLSASVAINDYDHRAEFQKNVAAVSRLLQSLPAGARVTILGITDQSFSQPALLLSAELSSDEGYFKERLAVARNDLVRAWQARSLELHAQFSQTDLCGALLVAAELFRQTPDTHKVLVLYSDMRHHTRVLDVESPSIIPVDAALARVGTEGLQADLRNVQVFALGVDNAHKSIRYWDALKQFWTAYFVRAGADLHAFSVLRDPPSLEGIK